MAESGTKWLEKSSPPLTPSLTSCEPLVDDRPEGGADDDPDREIDDIPTQSEFFELLQHGFSP